MINSSFGLGSILGIILVLSGVGLYLLRTMRPTLARDQDIFFAAIALLCGGILVFQSWRLDPILQFAQFLSGASAIWFAVEAIRLRGITTEQAKRTAPPIVDDDRPVSRVYRAELDELTPLEDQRTVTRRIRGGRNGQDDDWEGTRRSTRASNSDYSDGYADSPRRSSNPRESLNEGRPRSSRSERSLSGDRPDRTPSWDEDDKPVRRPRLNSADGASRSESSARPSAERPNSARSNAARSNSSRVERVRPPASQRRNSEPSSDYVDYQPIDRPDSGSPRDYE
jgi:Ycf66 protein N-terminus